MLDISDRRHLLRSRITQINTDGLFDEDIIEALLTYCRIEKTRETSINLMRHFRSIDTMAYASIAELQTITGVDKESALFLYYVAKAALKGVEERERQYHVTSPDKAAAILAPYFEKLENEVVIALYLSQDLHFISIKPLYEGNISSAKVDAYAMISQAINLHSKTVILAHNHPFGTSSASSGDSMTTVQLLKLCNEMGILLLDHIIIGQRDYFSFALDNAFSKEDEPLRKIYLQGQEG